MGLLLSGVSKSSKVVAMPAASSLRAGITTLLRRADLAPAVLIIAGISFLAHVLIGDNYGYFRDELYVLAMSHHPAFGYVDVPPLVPWITLIPRLLTGNALWPGSSAARGGSRDSLPWDRRRPSSCLEPAQSTAMMSSMHSGGH